jgi:hypothetical protein
VKVSDFVGSVASTVGNDALQGAIILVAIDRDLDRMIQKSLALDCFHPGKPSPWSHTFLLAAPFTGPDTPILDCTIRDEKGHIAFKLKLIDMIKTVLNKAGGVYSSKLSDYDIDQVHPVGVKLIPDATLAERVSVVAIAIDLQKKKIHYEFLGLVRELIRMLFPFIPIKPLGPDLFCSAFCQFCYRAAFGTGPTSKGDFLPGLDSKDVSPDDIWFSRAGANYPPTNDIPIPTFDDLLPRFRPRAQKSSKRYSAKRKPARSRR